MAETKDLVKEINETIDSVVYHSEKFGPDFKFRGGQKDTILKIVYSVLHGQKESLIIDAPTGSGKSIIAMVAGSVLAQMGKTGYIITSNLELQEQYWRDMKKFGLGWATIKGRDNYMCTDNNEVFSQGTCQTRNYSSDKIKNLSCYNGCPYFSARNKASMSPVTLMNYSNWLIHQNYVKGLLGESAPFPTRDFVFFDEAHMIDDIVQNHFSPTIDDVSFLADKVYSFIDSYTNTEIPSDAVSVDTLKNIFVELFEDMSQERCKNLLDELTNKLSVFAEMYEPIIKEMNARFDDQPDKNWREGMKYMKRIYTIYASVLTYLQTIDELGLHNLVKKVDEYSGVITLNILDCGKMLERHMHTQAKKKIFMSATFGQVGKYVNICNIPNPALISLANGFNFDKSPIFIVDGAKMSFKILKQSFDQNIEILDKILDRHQGERGIIHTGSYKLSQWIMNESRHAKRIFDYGNSKEKSDTIYYHKKSENGILIGPSLIEGIDMKDDLSRFQIFFKVPYPSLGDEYVKKKFELDKEWYYWKTALAIQQGVGRSVRGPQDWAKTYLLDGNFKNFLKYNRYYLSETFTKRLLYLKQNKL